jgi:hypothetical protein
MDVWKPQELGMMRYGGNGRMADYLDEHGPKDWRKLPITQKYDQKAAIAYRKQLKEDMASGVAPPTKTAESRPENPFAPKKKAPAVPPTTSAFSLFEIAFSAESLVDSLAKPLPSKQQAAGYPAADVQKPARTAEQQRKLDLANAELKRLQNQAQDATPCTGEATKVEVAAVPKKAEASKKVVDIWGDDIFASATPCTGEAKKVQVTASSSLKAGPQPSVLSLDGLGGAMPCTVEANKSEVAAAPRKAAPAVDVWGDDLWDF